MIELTKDEVQAVINTLAALPFKDVAGLIQFFAKKIEDASVKQAVKEKEAETPA